MRRIKAGDTPYIQFHCIESPFFPDGIKYLKADLDISRFEGALRQGISCGGERLVDGVGPVIVVAVVGNQWFDEVPPHRFVVEQATLDECPTNCAACIKPSPPPLVTEALPQPLDKSSTAATANQRRMWKHNFSMKDLVDSERWGASRNPFKNRETSE